MTAGAAQDCRPAVFLDRDGVINRPVIREGKPYAPADVSEFELLPGVVEACQRLKQAGFVLVIVTNQPEVGRGTQPQSAVEEINEEILSTLPIDRIEVCYDPQDGPEARRRKPKPGMLMDAAEELGICLDQSYMVGDRWRDIECGQAAGCRTIFIDWGYDEKQPTKPDYYAADLTAAAKIISDAAGDEKLQLKAFVRGSAGSYLAETNA